jgi:hypothetical protein
MLMFTAKQQTSELQVRYDAEFARRTATFLEDYNIEIEAITRELSDQSEFLTTEARLKSEAVSRERELASISIPAQVAGMEIASIAALSQRVRDLPRFLSSQKTALLADWNHQVESEEERHAQYLLGNLSNDQVRHLVRDSAAEKLLLELDQEIDCLTIDLRAIEVPSTALLIDGDPDEQERQRLREQLAKLRQERRRLVREAEEAAQAERAELDSKIALESAAVAEELNQEQSTQERLNAEHRKEYETQRHLRKTNEETAEAQAAELNDENQRIVSESESQFQTTIGELEQSVLNEEMLTNHADTEFEDDYAQAQTKFDEETDRLAKLFLQQLADQRELESKPDGAISAILVQKTKERDAAKHRYMSKPMRREELEIVKRVDRQLAIKTQQLATVGKELLLYRQHLVHQEDEYNNRFGADPSVAILRPKSAKKRPSTAMTGARLPSLGSSSESHLF